MDKFENTKDKITSTKDKAVGKVIETAGKIINDEELEFTGKFRQATTEVKDKLYDVKEDVFQEGNKLMDRVDDKLKGDNNYAGRK